MYFKRLIRTHPCNRSVISVLGYIFAICDEKGDFSLSHRKMASDIGLSRRQIQFSIDILLREDILTYKETDNSFHIVCYENICFKIKI